MKSKTTLFTGMAVAALVAVLLLTSLIGAPVRDVQAAPMAVPTPLSLSANGANAPRLVTAFRGTGITASARSDCFELGMFDKMNIQYAIDQNTAATNTTTIKLQFSNDLVTYTDGINVVATNSADASDMIEANVFGRYTCVYATLTNSNRVTPSLSIWAK